MNTDLSARFVQSLSMKELKKLIAFHRGLMREIPIHKQAFWELQQELGRRELIAAGILPRGSIVQIKDREGDFIVVHDSSRGKVNVASEAAFKQITLQFETIDLSAVCGF